MFVSVSIISDDTNTPITARLSTTHTHGTDATSQLMRRRRKAPV